MRGDGLRHAWYEGGWSSEEIASFTSGTHLEGLSISADPLGALHVTFLEDPNNAPTNLAAHGSPEEDEKHILVLLEQHGLQVVQADNALSALKELRKHADIVIVLMDVMMPQLDGNETIRMIREMPRYRDLTIIAVTAKAMKGDREQSIAAGATEYLTKPVDADRLFDLLSEHLPAGMTSEPD